MVAGRAKEKIDSIGAYEKRVIKVQKLVRDGPDQNHDADKEVDNMLRAPFSRDIRGEFATCASCNERFVKHLLLQHTIYCAGGTRDDESTAAGTAPREGEDKKDLGPDDECFCQLCGKKFTGKTIDKHTKKCEERQKFLESKEGQESALISLLPPQKVRHADTPALSFHPPHLTPPPLLLLSAPQHRGGGGRPRLHQAEVGAAHPRRRLQGVRLRDHVQALLRGADRKAAHPAPD